MSSKTDAAENFPRNVVKREKGYFFADVAENKQKIKF